MEVLNFWAGTIKTFMLNPMHTFSILFLQNVQEVNTFGEGKEPIDYGMLTFILATYVNPAPGVTLYHTDNCFSILLSLSVCSQPFYYELTTRGVARYGLLV